MGRPGFADSGKPIVAAMIGDPCGIGSEVVLPQKSSSLNLLHFFSQPFSLTAMLKWLGILVGTLRSALRSQQELALENLALRHQLAAVKLRRPRPRLTDADRMFWVLMLRLRKNWRTASHGAKRGSSSADQCCFRSLSGSPYLAATARISGSSSAIR